MGVQWSRFASVTGTVATYAPGLAICCVLALVHKPSPVPKTRDTVEVIAEVRRWAVDERSWREGVTKRVTGIRGQHNIWGKTYAKDSSGRADAQLTTLSLYHYAILVRKGRSCPVAGMCLKFEDVKSTSTRTEAYGLRKKLMLALYGIAIVEVE